MIKGLIRDLLQYLCFFSKSINSFKALCLSIYHFYFWVIDEYAYTLCDFGLYRIVTHILLTMAEMVIFKILYLYKFSVIAAMDEYFFTNFVTLLNFMINFGLTIIRFSLGEHRRTRLYFSNFAKPFEVYSRITWP